MEQNTSLFSLGIDPANKAHLSETARWARFLAIVGMISLGLGVVFALFWYSLMSRMASPTFDNAGFNTGTYTMGMRIGSLIMLFIVLVLWFIPLLFLLRFANSLRVAVRADDQEAMTVAFLNLKRFFRYIGIITLIGLILYAFILVIAIVGGSLMR